MRKPALRINEDLTAGELREAAEYRMEAGKGLLFTLGTIDTRGAGDIDLKNVALAAYLLLEDTADLYGAALNAKQESNHG